MEQLILISIEPGTNRVAILENHELQEFYLEHTDKPELVGNIYKGKIVRLLPGLQTAFVDIGAERTAFLQHADFSPKFREGQELLVQVNKDPVDGKGARLTTTLSIASRCLVFMPSLTQASISYKITAPAERERLQNLLAANNFIIRSAAANAVSLEEDKNYLLDAWENINAMAATAKIGSIIHKEPSLPQRIFRDLLNNDNVKILVDDAAVLSELRAYVARFMPNFQGTLQVYNATMPLLAQYKVPAAVKVALQRKVSLNNGGYLIIDQHEAMTTIDVNTGSYVGKQHLETTVFETNIEAVAVICKQIRLRNIGGIIIIDFIDMRKREHLDAVLNALRECLGHDKIKTKVNDFSTLGLVEMTRQRMRPSLQQILCKQCSACQGNGIIIADIL